MFEGTQGALTFVSLTGAGGVRGTPDYTVCGVSCPNLVLISLCVLFDLKIHLFSVLGSRCLA